MIRVEVIMVNAPEEIAKKHGALFAEALQDACEFWHDNILPRHFQLDARRKYSYQARTAPYMRYKARRFGHQRPLELTGDLRRQTTGAVTLRKSKGQATAAMRAPKYLYQYRPGAPNKAAELVATVTAEIGEMAKVISASVQEKLDRLHEEKREKLA